MLKSVGHILMKTQGWTIVGEELVQHRRCIVIAAPHTSNWAFFLYDRGLRRASTTRAFYDQTHMDEVPL